MNVLETILSAGGGGVVKQLAGQFGITPDQATSSVSAMLPALANGAKEKLASGDSSGLSQLISGGSLTKFADNPKALATPAAIEQGTSLLSKIFGAQELSGIASAVVQKSGVESSVATRLLPIGAALFGGLLSRSTAAGDKLTDVVGQLGSIGHGGILDAVKGVTAKMFG
jgi:hypothetical protein